MKRTQANVIKFAQKWQILPNTRQTRKHHMAIWTWTQNQLIMKLIKLDCPDPMRMISSGSQRNFGRSDVEKSDRTIITSCGQMILFVGIEIDASNQWSLVSHSGSGNVKMPTWGCRSGGKNENCSCILLIQITSFFILLIYSTFTVTRWFTNPKNIDIYSKYIIWGKFQILP